MAAYKFYEDISFGTGETGVVRDVYTDLGRAAISGYIANTGSGALTFQMSVNGTDYGDAISLAAGEVHHFSKEYKDAFRGNLNINKIKINWVSDTSYKIYVD